MPDQQPTPTCGATNIGMFGRLLGPCLNAPRHPEGSWHRDARGTEWRNHEPADVAPAGADWEQQDDGTWTLPIDGGTVAFPSRTTPEERARFAEEWKRRQKPELCADCITGTHGPNAHRKHLPPAIQETCEIPHQTIAEEEACDTLKRVHIALAEQQRQRADQVEDLLRIAHDTSNKSEAERARAVSRAEQIEADLAKVRGVLDEVLRHFVHPGHPGEPCLSTGWISVKTVNRWRAIAYPTKDGSK